MRERPILFSGAMVRAILDGRKTQTRRQITSVQRIGRVSEFGRSDTPGYFCQMRDARLRWNELKFTDLMARCPYGQPGDQIWVRETFKDVCSGEIKNGSGEVRYGTAYAADNAVVWKPKPTIIHDLSGQPSSGPMQFKPVPWSPSIHMPRRASRITLGIASIRVEPLNAISHADSEAEGVHRVDIGSGYWPKYGARPFTWAEAVEQQADCHDDARLAYRDMWEQINGPGSWAANPWVWVIEFTQVHP